MTFAELPRFPGRKAWAAAMLFLAIGPAHALMIAVYTRAGEAMKTEEMRALAAAAKADLATFEVARDERFTVKVSEKAVLSAEFSVPPGVSAYFWSDETFARDGYAMAGEAAHYEVEVPSPDRAMAKEALAVDAPEKVYVTAFRGASMAHDGLRVGYSVSRPGRVEVEAMGLNGQRFGAWRVTETSAGEHERVFPLNASSKGPFYVRWSHGDARAARKVNPVPRD